MEKGRISKTNMLENVKLLVAQLKKKTRKEAKGGDGKEPRKVPPEDWEVKERGAIPTLNIRRDTLTVVHG